MGFRARGPEFLRDIQGVARGRHGDFQSVNQNEWTRPSLGPSCLSTNSFNFRACISRAFTRRSPRFTARRAFLMSSPVVLGALAILISDSRMASSLAPLLDLQTYLGEKLI